jgi:hypothetical protein
LSGYKLDDADRTIVEKMLNHWDICHVGRYKRTKAKIDVRPATMIEFMRS